jgi:hypothetical protein
MDDAVLDHWRTVHGLVDFTAENLAPHRAAALADLRANEIRDDQLNANNRLLRAGAEKLGLRGEVMLHNRLGCIGLGTCLIGCPNNAKQGTRMVSIPMAIAAGARVVVRARAHRIEGGSAAEKIVHVRTLDERGHTETGAFTVRPSSSRRTRSNPPRSSCGRASATVTSDTFYRCSRSSRSSRSSTTRCAAFAAFPRRTP